MKFKNGLEKFTQDLEKKKRSISTILAYRKDVEQLIQATGNKELDKIGADEIEKFKAQLTKDGYTSKSVSRKINALKSFFRFAKKNQWVKTDPAAVVTHPKYETKAPRILSRLEYRSLRDVCREDIRMAAVVELLLQTGLRIGELARLTLADVDLKKDLVTIKAYQSQSSRQVPLNTPAKKSLEQYLPLRPQSKNDIFFLTKTGNPFLVRNIRSAVNRYFRLADIKNARVNDLRNTFIVQQLQAGVALTTISKIVGHKRLSTTEKYLEMVQENPPLRRAKLEAL